MALYKQPIELTVDLTDIESTIDSLDTRITELENASDNVDLSGIEASVSGIDGRLTIIESISESLNTVSTSQNLTLLDHEERITTLEAQDINGRIGTIELGQSNLQSNFNSLTSTFVSLTNTVNSQESTLNYVNNENATQRGQIADLQAALAAIPRQVFPQGFQHFHDTSKIVAGGALSSVQVAASFYSTMWQQNPAAINDSFSFKVLLDAGTYTLVMLVTRANNKGDLKLTINGVQAFNDVSGYNSTTTHERITRTITITTAGMQEFVFTVWGKNTLSTGYAFLINKISAFRN